MICEKCGKELNSLLVDMFNYDGSDSDQQAGFFECEENAVVVDVNSNWVGCGLSEEEMLDTVACPHCKQFPFKSKEIQVYEIVRLVFFKAEQRQSIELKPCPFCGGEAAVHACAELENEGAKYIYSGKHGVHCTKCHISTLPYETRNDAVSAWNRRVYDAK